MGLHYKNLDNETRKFMLSENDIGGHYHSPRIEDGKMTEWLTIFREALSNHNDDWLANEAIRKGLIKSHETRRTPSGGTTTVKVPSNAAQQLAEGEFNRFYLRAIAVRAQNEGKKLRIYRGKEAKNPRPESERKIGNLIEPTEVIEKLRNSDFLDNASDLPIGPNSGLTAEIV